MSMGHENFLNQKQESELLEKQNRHTNPSQSEACATNSLSKIENGNKQIENGKDKMETSK